MERAALDSRLLAPVLLAKSIQKSWDMPEAKFESDFLLESAPSPFAIKLNKTK